MAIPAGAAASSLSTANLPHEDRAAENFFDRWNRLDRTASAGKKAAHHVFRLYSRKT
jgi:hypothetical protein